MNTRKSQHMPSAPTHTETSSYTTVTDQVVSARLYEEIVTKLANSPTVQSADPQTVLRLSSSIAVWDCGAVAEKKVSHISASHPIFHPNNADNAKLPQSVA